MTAVPFIVASPLLAACHWPIGVVISDPLGARLTHTILVQVAYEVGRYHGWLAAPSTPWHIVLGMFLYWSVRAMRSMTYLLLGTGFAATRGVAPQAIDMVKSAEKSNNPCSSVMMVGTAIVGVGLGAAIDGCAIFLGALLVGSSDLFSTTVFGAHAALRQ